MTSPALLRVGNKCNSSHFHDKQICLRDLPESIYNPFSFSLRMDITHCILSMTEKNPITILGKKRK